MPEDRHTASQFIRRSIFLKLFLIYLGTSLALIVVVGSYNRRIVHNEHAKHTRSKMMAHHLAGIIDDIGHPPDRERAISLMEKLGLQLRVEGPEATWATASELPDTTALDIHPSEADPEMQRGTYHGRRVVSMVHGSTRYLFFFPEPPELDLESVGLLVGLIALILAGSYGLIRWLFRPLDWLTCGVAEIAKGNFEYQVRTRSDDELGQLSLALNMMVTRIRDMLKARDRLLVDVSHELRSPLTRIKVALELLRDEAAKAKIQQDVRELEAMVTELLESERLNSDHGGVTLSENDLVPLVRDLVKAYQDHSPGVRLVTAPANCMLQMDASRVRTALRNILDNALTHTDPAQGPVEVRLEIRKDAVDLSVSDHGSGVLPEEQTLIFEPFYRVDKSRTRATGGYGLGLSLAQQIMRAHGGDILVASQSDCGSIFTLTFPLLPQMAWTILKGLATDIMKLRENEKPLT